MPSFVIVNSLGRTGETVDAILCDPGAAGFPDQISDAPVRIQVVSEQTLCVDGEARGIISAIGSNGSTTFFINGSTKALRHRERRAALGRASTLLQQLASTLKPLQAESDEPGLATEGLGMLFNWITDEREAATSAPRPETTNPREFRNS